MTEPMQPTAPAEAEAASEPKKVGRRIRQLRGAAGLKQAELADAIGVKAGEVSSWEAGLRRPGIEKAGKLVSVLGTDLDYLFLGASETPELIRQEAVDPDADLDTLSPADLLAAARAMRRAIRAHRDASGHDLCWRQPELWALLPDPPKSGQVVPDWPQFMSGCVRYRQSLDQQLPDAPRSAQEFGG